MPQWDSGQYTKFINERTQPAYDLAARISHTNPKKIIDIGCGPGNSTEVLLQNWPEANISGFDSSPEMLAQAKASNSSINWFESCVEEWSPSETFDIIFSNAVFQWVQEHKVVLPRLLNILNDGGALAIQMPARYNSPLHKQLIEVAEMPEWVEYTGLPRTQLSLSEPSFYYDLLAPITSRLDIWETKYFHIMDDVQAILEWFRGAGLRPFLEALPDNQARESFELEVLRKYSATYPKQKNGKVLFPFNRFFFIGYK